MGQRMRRFLVGLTLLVFAITLPLHGPARGEHELTPELYLKLLEQLHLWHGTEAEREEELKRLWEERKRREQHDMEVRHMHEKMQSLAEVGPTFVFWAFDGSHPLHDLRAACLVGDTGKIYIYDFKKDGAQAPGVVDGREFSKAVDLAKSLEHVEWRPVLARALEHADISRIRLKWDVWHVLLDGRIIPLQIAGDYVGAHPNPQAAELVKLIDGWCPYAPEIRSRLEQPAFEGRPRPPYR
jgi:hypothetical protein